jgi:putative ABC transport system ATP-binding protein
MTPPADRAPVLDVQDVFKIYELNGDRTVALRGSSLRIQDGEFVALLGRSGSGKSTLLHIIAGLDTPSAGRVYLNGRDIARLSEEERSRIRQRTVGLVLQRDNLLPYLTALENVALPLQLMERTGAEARARELLRQVGLANRTDHRAYQLSDGEAQRVSIALALAAGPRLLLGDEISGELDSATAAGILDLLSDLHARENMSLLVVTHDRAVAKRAQRVVHMRDGIVEGERDGSPA